MIRQVILCLLSTLAASTAIAQPSRSSENSLNMDMAFAKWQGTASAAFVHDWSLGAKRRMVVGLGGRMTGYLGRNQYYITAPAELTSGDTGPGVIFTENIPENIDTFLIANPVVFAVNAEINLGFRFSDRFSMGFNIDLLGFSFGPERSGNYINGAQGGISSSKPTSFNVLLVSDNDIGTLNSQLYAKYSLAGNWSLRAGLQFLFTEYTTATDVQQYPEPNDRFRRKSLMGMVGASYRLK